MDAVIYLSIALFLGSTEKGSQIIIVDKLQILTKKTAPSALG
jgi:hypothetical protein